MRKVDYVTLITLLLTGSLALPSPPENTVIIGFKEQTDPSKLTIPDHLMLERSITHNLLLSQGTPVKPTTYPYRITCSSREEAQELLQSLSQNPLIKYAEKSCPGQLKEITPNDTNFSQQWQHQIISSPAAWQITTGSPEITVAILDTGITNNLTEFNNRLVPGFDFVNNDNNPADDMGHGTRVTAVGFANGNDNFGTAGVDWNCRIMPIKIAGSDGNLNDFDVADGVNFAVNNGARVINLSLGFNGFSQTLMNAIDNAISNGCIVIAAASEGNQNGLSFPASLPQVIAVGATDSNDAKHTTSGISSSMDIVAPGRSIRTTNTDGSLTSRSGTSYSAPIASAAASLLLSVNPSLNQSQIEIILSASADDQVGSPSDPAGFDSTFGHGRLNIHAALLLLQGHMEGLSSFYQNGATTQTLSWIAPPNASSKQPYQFEYSNGLDGWTSFSSNPTLTFLPDNRVSWTDTGSLTSPPTQKRFYRFRLVR